MITREQSADAYNRYVDMVMQGADPMTAYQQSGLGQISRDIAGRQTSAQSKAGMGQIGGQLVGALGTQYATGTGLFAAAPAAVAPVATVGGTAAATGAATAGAAGAAGTAGTAGAAGAAPTMAALAGPAAVVAGAVAAGLLFNRSMEKHGRGRDLSDALKSASKDPVSYLGPGFLGAAFGSAFKGGRAKFENKKMTSELLDMGFKPQDLAVFGRVNDQGEIQQVKTTKAQQDEWKKLTQSKDINVNPLKIPTAMWGSGGVLKTFGPDYFDKMSEFERYAASAAAIKSGQIFQDKGELKIKDQDLVRQTYEQLKQDPEMQARYNQWKQTGKDQGIA